jgi:hypothetical protein
MFLFPDSVLHQYTLGLVNEWLAQRTMNMLAPCRWCVIHSYLFEVLTILRTGAHCMLNPLAFNRPAVFSVHAGCAALAFNKKFEKSGPHPPSPKRESNWMNSKRERERENVRKRERKHFCSLTFLLLPSLLELFQIPFFVFFVFFFVGFCFFRGYTVKHPQEEKQVFTPLLQSF